MAAWGWGEPEAIVMDEEGWVNPVFFVDDRWVFRFNARDPELPKFQREAAAMERLRAEGFATPVVERLEVESDTSPYPVLVTRRLPGTNMERRWKELDRAEQVDAARRAGALLARIHGVRFKRFGELVEGGGLRSSRWSDVASGMLEEQLELARKLGVFDDDARRRFTAALRAGEGWLCQVEAPVLVHYDFHFGNLLLGETEITGVLDFEWCFAGDPAADLSILGSIEEFCPGSREPFVAGYAEVRPMPPVERIRLAQMIRNVTLCNIARRHFPPEELGEYVSSTLAQLEKVEADGRG